MTKYKLLIIWDTEPEEIREEHYFDTMAEAQKAKDNVELAFGMQMEWMGICEVTK